MSAEELARRVARSKTPTEWREEAREKHYLATLLELKGQRERATMLFRRAVECARWAELAERLERTNETVADHHDV